MIIFIPRFWIDWQQKQMQDQIEELEYIKNNMIASSNSSLMSNETDDVEMDLPKVEHRPNYTELRRKSLLFLHEAQRLADERRASLARTTTIDIPISDKSEDTSDHEKDQSFSFDQRSEETSDTANLNDFKENPSTSEYFFIQLFFLENYSMFRTHYSGSNCPTIFATSKSFSFHNIFTVYLYQYRRTKQIF
jgi:hypothetical protein